MLRKQSIKSHDQQNLQRMKKDKQTSGILTTFTSSGNSRSNDPISSAPPPPQGCLRSLCSSNSSRTHFHSKLKNHSKMPDKPFVVAPMSVPNNLSRTRSKHSKENDIPRATSRKLGNGNRCLLSRRPTSKPVPRSKLLSDLSNSSSGSEQFRLNSKSSKEGHEGIGSGTHIVLPQRFEQPKNSNCEESRTPFGKDDRHVESDSVSGHNTSVKTPPIEASVSPEIQYGAAATTAAAATPVCYGTSHLLSGVKDKRKCRSKGILIAGDEIASVEDGSSNDMVTKSRPSFVPSPAEAAMIWLSSPKHDADKFSESSVGASSSTLKSCSQLLSVFASDTEHSDNNSINVNDGGDSSGKTRIVLLSPKRFPSFHRWLGGSGGETDIEFSSSPSSLISASNEANCGSIVKEKYSLSSSSLSCGNVIQTPTSDLSSDNKAVEFRWTDTENHQRKLDLGAEIPDSTSLDHKEYYNKLKEERASYVSDSTLASMSLSGMRISWREGLGSQTFDTDEDELDCCRCLSDEEEEYDCHGPNICQTSSPNGVKTAVTENLKPFGSVGGLRSSPGSLELEDDNNVEKVKKAMFQAEPNVSAESICLDGDRLIASGDSDWAISYKNHLFRV